MNVQRDPDSILGAWLDEGPTDLPDATRRAILTSLPTTSQARRGPLAPWRFFPMNTYTRLAAAAIVAVIAIGGAIYVLNPRGGFGPGGPAATPVPTATPAPTVTLQPTPTVLLTGTITLTDTGCTWTGKPTSLTASGGSAIVRFAVRNETDTFGNFGIYSLKEGRTWEEAAAWILVDNESLHGGPSHPPQDFATDVGNLDAPERQDYTTEEVLGPGTYGIVCSSNEPPPGEVFAIYLVGPLEIAGS